MTRAQVEAVLAEERRKVHALRLFFLNLIKVEGE